ncbi:MAG: hypothetical protein PHE59_03445 [Patescibacteria group bacterium]|nr:hypothetical protein [Patescibacteria group bacterium]MDD5164232.1 hypothetical protein [Patescibacteria group bacterium]MDD5534650.1 hypothetical protein [Patescibacteria group bacterium]
MINKIMLQKLSKEYKNHVSMFYLVNQQSNVALHKSKQAIFSLQRDQISEAEKSLKEVEQIFIKLQGSLTKSPQLLYAGAYKAALEEYAEAKLFWQAIKFGQLKEISEIKLGFESYLGGICDLTGELVRKIVLLATEDKVEKARELKELITQVVGELIKLDLTGYLRTKYDDAKRNLKKAEEILYDLKIRSK